MFTPISSVGSVVLETILRSMPSSRRVLESDDTFGITSRMVFTATQAYGICLKVFDLQKRYTEGIDPNESSLFYTYLSIVLCSATLRVCSKSRLDKNLSSIFNRVTTIFVHNNFSYFPRFSFSWAFLVPDMFLSLNEYFEDHLEQMLVQEEAHRP